METALVFYFLLLNLLLWISLSLYITINSNKISFLKDQPLPPSTPPIAIIIAVRNEEEHLREALSSVCKLDYPSLRIVVVNDRSTDKTNQILMDLVTIYPQLVIETITVLPTSWLGKTHALHHGAQKVKEDWLLFTDADVLFHPHALKKAMGYALAHNLAHLTVLPQVKSRDNLLNAVLPTFQLMLEIKLRPWLAKNSKSSAFIGVGAFNLIEKAAYDQIGGHKEIRLRPDDDLQLAKAIKRAGFKPDVVYGQEQVELEWYANIREFIAGLMKNTFAALDYQLWKSIGAFLGTLIFFFLPIPLGLCSGNLPTQLLALSILIVQVIFCLVRKGFTAKWWFGIVITYAGALMAYIILKATFLTLKNKGIYWRDHFYSLKELKENQ